MKIAIAADHRGVELKEACIKMLKEQNYIVLDLGTNVTETKVDYPDFAAKVSEAILNKEADYGILICHSGIGMSIAANRYKGIRAALCLSPEYAKLARAHNDANIIVFGSGFIDLATARQCLASFLNTKFLAKHHSRRLSMLDVAN